MSGQARSPMWYEPRADRDPDVERYVAWLNERLGQFRGPQLMTLVDGLRRGSSQFGGAVIPTHVLQALQALLPEIEAELADLGGPLQQEPLPRRAPMWPERTRAQEREIREALAALTEYRVPPPFPIASHHAVGNLLAVGWAPRSELLVVVSASGVGVFDGSGRKVGRKVDADLTGYPDRVAGIAPIAGVEVRLMGCEGGTALSRTTADGWQLGVLAPEHCQGIWLAPAGRALEPPAPTSIRLAGHYEEIRAAGFSDSGRTLVIAEQHTLHLFHAKD